MKIKHLATMIMTAAMISGVNVRAYDSYLEGKYVNISSVEFKTDEGVISTLPSSGEVIVSTKIKKAQNADMIQTVTLVAALYNGEKLVGTESNVIDLSDEYTHVLETTVDVDGITGIRVFVCNNTDDGVPFAAKAIFAAPTTDIMGIFVGGEEIEEFAPDKTEYDILVSAAHTSFPEITPRLTDAGIKCTVETEGVFPLDTGESATAVVKIDNSAEKTYTLNITQQQPEITNLKAVTEVTDAGEVLDELASIVTGVTEVKYAVEPEEPIKISTNSATGADMTLGYGTGNISGTGMFSDRAGYPIAFVPDVLKKSYMIRTSMDFDRGNGSNISFDINRPATVYVSAKNGADLVAQGYELVNGMSICWINCNAEQGRLYKYAAYKKHFDVEAGEPVRVEAAHGVINAFVVFDESAPVSNARLKNRSGELISLPLVDIRNAEYTDKKSPDYKEGIGSYTYAAKFVSDRMTDTYGFVAEFPQQLQGATGIAVPYNPRKYNSSTTNKEFISFDLNQSAEVYIAYDANPEEMPWMEELGYIDVSDAIDPIGYVCSEDSTEYTTRIYKKAYTVIPGETIKVDIGGLAKVDNDSNIPVMIFVKKINN